MIKVILKRGRIVKISLLENAIRFAPLLKTTACGVKYSRGMPWGKAARGKKEKDSHSETSFYASEISFRISEKDELCVIVDGEEEDIRFPLGYVREIKILS